MIRVLNQYQGYIVDKGYDMVIRQGCINKLDVNIGDFIVILSYEYRIRYNNRSSL